MSGPNLGAAFRTMTPEQVASIRHGWRRGLSWDFLARSLGKTKTCVRQAGIGITYAHIPGAITEDERMARRKA